VRLWPRSLAGQLALVSAVALFVGQAINFGLILRERATSRLAQASRPVATRVADLLEREAAGVPPIRAARGRVRRLPVNPIPAAGVERRPEVADELRRQLAELGVTVGRIDTQLLSPPDPASRQQRRRWRARASPRLLIAVEQPGRGWLVSVAPWSRPGPRILFMLLVQTLVIYLLTLLPLLWVARRLSRPLRDLTRAAVQFDPLRPPPSVPEQGPEDLRQLIAAFQALWVRVSAMLTEKDRMLGAIGHDLRTPLAALRVRIESVEDEQDRSRMAETVMEMSRTLDDILSLARLGRPGEPITEVDLSALVDAVVEDFRDLGAEVAFAPSDRLPVRLHPAAIRRALRNLIENAIKYAGQAEVRLEAGTDAVRVIVADEGPGIPPEQLESVFDPFTRIEQSRNRETGGIGLGLALARGIAREAGGEVTLANRPTGGLDATLTLPR
jgi:signal transduction histidine kinase